jgi:hypothetical protein
VASNADSGSQPTHDPAPATPKAEAPAGEGLPDRDALTMAWSDAILPKLSGLTKAMFAAGRFTSVEKDAAVFALPNAAHRDRCEGKLPAVEQALADHFGRPVPLRLIVDSGEEQPSLLAEDPPPAPAPAAESKAATAPEPEPDEPFDHHDLEPATDQPVDGVARVTQAFPGAQLVDDDR